MSVDSWEIQKAIYTLLKSDATLLGLGVKVYDHVPETASAPYISIGDDTLTDMGGKGFDAADATLTLHTWTEGRGRKQVKTIHNRIRVLVAGATLPMAGQQAITTLVEFETTTKDPDDRTTHGIMRIRSHIYED